MSVPSREQVEASRAKHDADMRAIFPPPTPRITICLNCSHGAGQHRPDGTCVRGYCTCAGWMPPGTPRPPDEPPGGRRSGAAT